MRCVPINPLAVPPQIKKLPASSQKVDELKTSERGTDPDPFDNPRKEVSDTLEATRWSLEPYGSRPRSAGSSRIQRKTGGISASATPTKIRDPARHPAYTITAINSGRKISCPVE